MKFVTEEELAGHQAATIRGAIEGTIAGLAISLPASFIANRYWAAYRAMPIQLKVLGVITVVLPTWAIGAERRGVEFDESTWTGAGKAELERQKTEAQKEWDSLSTKDKIKNWAITNQYKVILGSWALSMGIAGAAIMGNRHQTMPQKIVQARMWAQGLTIGVLIGAGVLTHSQRLERLEHRTVDHTWANMLEEQQKEEQAQKEKLQIALQRANAHQTA